MHRIFLERGLQMPPVTYPIIPEKPTRPKEPKAYSSLALTFMRLVLDAEKEGLPYLIIYEDDAYPCKAPQATLDKLLADHPFHLIVGCCAWGTGMATVGIVVGIRSCWRTAKLRTRHLCRIEPRTRAVMLSWYSDLPISHSCKLLPASE